MSDGPDSLPAGRAREAPRDEQAVLCPLTLAGFLVPLWWGWSMPRRRDPDAGRVVYRTARVGVRVTPAQRERCFGLLRRAGDVCACVLEVNGWRRRRHAAPRPATRNCAGSCARPGRARSGSSTPPGRLELRRYSDAGFAAAKRRKDGDLAARFPRRRHWLLSVRWYHGTVALEDRRVRGP